ncbi:hypothetical protein [Pseudodesulfovibrio sp. zrk46]|uniref:hypothetical protein n=1 Tax=Pseudodesulfovibrio sp. zrk46 TaxID=2725288 RepID=UPI001449B8EC|nr:hypothetical protein [Pseudodesulfovibrio sp. zrk46]QJB56889.1 hypothetical protein HFN16_10955 [Pseudodesulfovibrio sp. zrk46]
MLEEKLKSSQAGSNKSFLILATAIVIVIAVTVLLAAELILNPDNSEEQAHSVEAPVVEKASTPSVQPEQSENGREQAAEEERIAFKAMLSEYESNIKALVEAPEFAVWDEVSQARFLKMKGQIMADVGTGKYGRARDELAELIQQATKVISERDAAVAESIEQAKSALKENAPQKARAHFLRVKELAPHSPELSALEPQVATLPQVVELLEQAHLAKVQGDMKGELAAWKEIAKVDPTNGEAEERIALIQNTIFEQELSSHLQKAMAALEARRPDLAQKSLNKARQMAPKRDEVVHLQREINTLAKELRYNALVKQARAYAAKDDWSSVLSSYNDAAKINGSSAEVVSGIKRAQTVLGIRAAIKEKLGKPYRLSTKVGEKQARALLQEASGVFEISSSTEELAKKLDALLQLYTKPVMVRVTSDGKTFVQVKGVGKVGKVTEKTIQIRPGRYVFEGKRDGFVSKATTVEIPPSGKTMVIHVVCETTI